MLKKTLKFLFLVILFLVLITIGWACQIYLGWPAGSMWLWPVTAILLWIIFTLARRTIVRYRALHRLKTQAPIEQALLPDQEWVSEVQRYLAMSKSVDKSVLGNHNLNFVLGLSSAGKSTLLLGSNSSEFERPSQISNTLSPTQSCKFTFLDSGIAIDISGRHIDPDRDTFERDSAWERLLACMSVDVLPEQCASVTVCISIDQLKPQVIGRTHQALYVARQRISDLMALAERRLPVYVVLTQADKLEGINNLITHLPHDLRNQAAGVLLPLNIAELSKGIRHAMAELARFMPWLGLRATQQGAQVEMSGLLATHDIRQLQGPIESALMSLFSSSSYRESAIFRGLFLSAALPVEKGASSNNARAMAFGPALFNYVLKRDRVYQPLAIYVQQAKRQKQIRWAAFYGAVALVAVWFFAGFMNAISEIDKAKQFTLAKFTQVHDARSMVHKIVSARPQVVWLTQQDNNSSNFLLPFSGVSAPLKEKLKENFVSAYSFFEENEIDGKFWPLFLENRDELFTAQAMDFMIFRYNALTAAKNNANFSQLSALPKPVLNVSTYLLTGSNPREASETYEMFLYYLTFETKDNLSNLEVRFNNRFTTLANSQTSLSWLNEWVTLRPGVNSVRLSDYWNPFGEPSKVEVPAAFTLAGYKEITKFLMRFDAVEPLREIFKTQQINYLQNYKLQRDTVWRNFILLFPTGRNLLKTEDDWVDVLSRFNSPSSPFNFLESRVLEEFPESGIKNLPRPEWVTAIDVVSSIRNSSTDTSVIGATSNRISTIQAAAPSMFSQSNIQSGSVAIQNERNLANATKFYLVFNKALAQAVTVAISAPGKAATLASDFSVFGRDPSVKDSSLRDAYNALARVQSELGASSQPINEPAWVILRGELVTTTHYAYLNAACRMQNDWQTQVLASTQMVLDKGELLNKVMGSEGTLWRYLDTTAKPFLLQSAMGYTEADPFEWSLPWQENFLSFINQAASEKKQRDLAQVKFSLKDKLSETRANARIKQIDARIPKIDKSLAQFEQTKFAVSISSFPLRANDDGVQPYGSSLTLSCAQKPQVLTQLNYSVTTLFDWNAQSCGDTELKIFVNNFKLTKRWLGEFGFTQFLTEFRDGKKSYLPSDFPEHEATLEELNIKNIAVTYLIKDGVVLKDAIEKYNSERLEKERLAEERQRLEDRLASLAEEPIIKKLSSLNAADEDQALPSVAVTCTL